MIKKKENISILNKNRIKLTLKITNKQKNKYEQKTNKK